MTNVNITATPRSDFGKGAARRIRRGGEVPGVIYGRGTELLHVSLPEHDLALALRKPRVVLNVTIDGAEVLTKPRDIQRDPVKLHLEHVDLVVITKQEAAVRSNYADAVAKAHALAEESGYDAASVVQALEAAVAAGEEPMAALEHVINDVKEQAAANAAAASAAAAAEAAAEAAAAEPAEGAAAAE
ncbi:MAG: hypothetical protein RJB01_555 [Actinomycetota bacterium]|jgi:large subunit ribosomal protein L25